MEYCSFFSPNSFSNKNNYPSSINAVLKCYKKKIYIEAALKDKRSHFVSIRYNSII